MKDAIITGLLTIVWVTSVILSIGFGALGNDLLIGVALGSIWTALLVRAAIKRGVRVMMSGSDIETFK